jgi:hypothetical protein
MHMFRMHCKFSVLSHAFVAEHGEYPNDSLALHIVEVQYWVVLGHPHVPLIHWRLAVLSWHWFVDVHEEPYVFLITKNI